MISISHPVSGDEFVNRLDSQANTEDIKLLLEGMWEGTKNLISRSKFGQMPRLLLKINYDSPRFFIGDIDRLISIKTDIPFERLRDINDFRLDATDLKNSLDAHKEKISSIEYFVDERLGLIVNGSKITLDNLAPDITFTKLSFV